MKTLRAIGQWLTLLAIITATLFCAALFLAAVDQRVTESIHYQKGAV